MLLTAALLTAALTLQVQPTPPVPQPPTPAAPPSEAAVAFARLEIPDGAGPAIEAGVWTPGADGGARRPLIVISHGNGGDFRSHEATARALAQAGFVVAALTHTGDNWRDQSRATDVAQRPRQLRVLVDYLLTDWTGRTAIDADRIDRVVNSLVRQLESSGESEIPSKQIGEMVMQTLQNLDPVAYIRYASVYKDFRHTSDFAKFLGDEGFDETKSGQD